MMPFDVARKTSDQPLVEAIEIDMPAPSLKDNTADLDRLVRTLARKGFDPVRIRPSDMDRLVRKIRKAGLSFRAVAGFTGSSWEIVDIVPNCTPSPVYGFSADLGTTSLVFRLIDLRVGKVVSESSVRNPQIEFGEDILARILFARNPEGLETLRKILVSSCSRAMIEMLEALDVDPACVYALSCAGNTAMSHFFWGLDPSRICMEPYIPAANTFPVCRAVELGFDLFPNALIFLFPNVGSYVGGDLISGIVAAGLHKSDKPRMLIDVGTNAEVILGNSEWLLACAGAAGPALEGGVVERGMQAAPGAIDRVRIDVKSLVPEWSTIGSEKAAGVCGSGLIDMVSEMFYRGILTMQGKLDPACISPRIRKTPDSMAYALALAHETLDGKELLVSETDIGVFLKSKAAMYTILSVISNKVGLNFKDIEKIYIAGNFGNCIDPEMAVRIGMIPDLPRDTYSGIGNSSLLGASMLLCDRTLLNEAEKVRSMITYVELNVNMELMNEFRGALFIPHTNRRLFPSVRVPDSARTDPHLH